MTDAYCPRDESATKVDNNVIAVTTSVNSLRGCSICGAAGPLRRGWCEKHYQRWYRNGSTDRPRDNADVVTFRCKVPFSVKLWNKWLVEFNAEPDCIAIESIDSLRNMIEEREQGSTWNKHHGARRR